MICPASIPLPRLRQASGATPVATAGAVLDALHALGVRRLAMASPYPESTNLFEQAYFPEHGIDVVSMKGLNI